MIPMVSQIKYLCSIARECVKSYRTAHKLLEKYKPSDQFAVRTVRKALLYCFFIPSLSFEYARLISHKPTKSETKLLLYLSLFSIFHDTLLDETPDGAEWLQELLGSPENVVATDSELQSITREIYHKIAICALIPQLRLVTEAQLYSQSLNNTESITGTDIFKALLLKGIIYPIYITPFNSDLSPLEVDCFTNLGGWLQSTDDISDKRQDSMNGIVTLATFENGKNAREIEMALWSNFTMRLSILQYEPIRASNYVLRMRLMGNIYRRYAALENAIPAIKSSVVMFPLLYIWLPLCFVSILELFSEKIKHI
jgi:hypothetical protein